MQKSLPVYGVKFKNLKEFTTTKKDRKRQVTRMPGESLRIDNVYDPHESILEPPQPVVEKKLTPQPSGKAGAG